MKLPITLREAAVFIGCGYLLGTVLALAAPSLGVALLIIPFAVMMMLELFWPEG